MHYLSFSSILNVTATQNAYLNIVSCNVTVSCIAHANVFYLDLLCVGFVQLEEFDWNK